MVLLLIGQHKTLSGSDFSGKPLFQAMDWQLNDDQTMKNDNCEHVLFQLLVLECLEVEKENCFL